MIAEDRGCFIETYTGRRAYLMDPQAEDICIEDIAWGLANECRFGGHVSRFYSVAQHSCYVSDYLPQGKKLAGLLHDSPEAYLKDLPRPLKALLPSYVIMEKRWAQVIGKKYDVSFCDPAIKHADNVLLVTEARDLKRGVREDWGLAEQPLPRPIIAMPPEQARRAFLFRFNQLYEPRKNSI
jgi:hypothetical protein